MMVIKAPAVILFFLLMFTASAAQAMDCGRASNVVENTVCDNPELVWLDRLFTNTFSDVMIADPQRYNRIAQNLAQARNGCVSESCLRSAYLHGIGELYGADGHPDWQGVWWNVSATHGNGGKIRITSVGRSELMMDAAVWGGIYHSAFSGKVTLAEGVGFTDKIAWGGGCSIILIPRPDNRLEVSSDKRGRCDMLLPGEMAIDGVYVKAENDPRPEASLLTLGIFPNRELDDRFRELAGSEYQQYLATATSFVYAQDLDRCGATVLTLWVKGMANQRSAIIMYTPDGKIWASRIEPGKDNKPVVSYLTTEESKDPQPKTLRAWRARFNPF